MASPTLVLVAALLLGPPSGGTPPVQNPKVSPTQPQPGEPAIAPAHIDTDPAAEPTPMPADPGAPDPALEAQPEPEPQPEPQPEPGSDELPTWQSQPVPPPQGGDPGATVAIDEWGVPIAPPVERRRPSGTGLFGAAGGLFGFMITRQWVSSIMCDDLYCGWRGNADRVLGLGVMGLAGGGGWVRGGYSAHQRHKNDEPAKKLTGRRAAGWTLFALGVGGLITDTVLYNLCYSSAEGPYTQIDGFSYTCSPVPSVVLIDFSTALGALGLGLGLSAESQLRHRKKIDVSLAPWGGRGQAGLSLSGRF